MSIPRIDNQSALPLSLATYTQKAGENRRNILSNTKHGESAKYVSSNNRLATETYKNEDGDTLTLNMHHVEYQNTAVPPAFQDGKELSEERWNEIVNKIRDEFSEMRKAVLRKFLEAIGFVKSDDENELQNDKGVPIDGEKEIAVVPEYWNAENTSQRIVDFALSFRELYSGTDEEYLQIVVGAIKEGFEQARAIMGLLPAPVQNLVDSTYELVMKKLDAWLSERAVGSNAQHEYTAASPATV